jgi:beta-lactam-binding protein with PASTA domain
MKEILKSRQFWRTLVLMGVASLLIIFVTILSLKVFTRHGKSYIVPDFTGLTMDQLGALKRDYGFNFVVLDSVFDENSSPGTVIRHDPLPNATVKRGRKFYITMASSVPDMVAVPNLIDLSLRQAIASLESRGLFVGTITYRPDRFQNVVLGQTYRGERIAPGEKVRRGAYINLVVSGTPQGFRDNFEDDAFDDEFDETLFDDEI